jgi:hypothetical protein
LPNWKIDIIDVTSVSPVNLKKDILKNITVVHLVNV